MDKTIRQFEEIIDTIVELRDVSEARLCEPIKDGKWSIIQIVGHLYYWDKFNLEQMVPKMADDVNLPKFPDHDQHNKEAMTFIEDHSVKSIIESFILTRKELIDNASRLDKDIRFTIGNGKRKYSVESFIKIFMKHDAHHLKQITEKLQKQ